MSDVQTGPIEGFWGVIPAGGSGTRLWPLSRANSPKFLHDLTGSGRSLLQGTVDRLTPLCATNLLIVGALFFALPLVLSIAFSKLFEKIGWVRPENYKLDFE